MKYTEQIVIDRPLYYVLNMTYTTRPSLGKGAMYECIPRTGLRLQRLDKPRATIRSQSARARAVGGDTKMGRRRGTLRMMQRRLDVLLHPLVSMPESLWRG